jgi:hypothetical protein
MGDIYLSIFIVCTSSEMKVQEVGGGRGGKSCSDTPTSPRMGKEVPHTSELPGTFLQRLGRPVGDGAFFKALEGVAHVSANLLLVQGKIW